MEQAGAWLMTQGPFAVATFVLGLVIRELWRARELLLARREDDVRTLIAALNASTAALEDLGEAVKLTHDAVEALGKVASARAASVEEFNRRAELVLQQRLTG